jgi:hypothetical protein
LSSDPGPDDRTSAGATDPADPAPADPDPADAGGSANLALAPLKKPPIPSSALEISLGTIQTLFASP